MKNNYIMQCHKNIQTKEGEKYCLSSLKELKDNLPKSKPLFYIGSDSAYNYFVFYEDRITKLTIGLKTSVREFEIKYNFPFEQKNYHLRKYPIYLKDL